ncbi:14591_t:CDS:2, partial [Funneliformis mosseae]
LRRIVYVRSILLKRKIKKGLSPDEINKLYGVYLSYRKSYEGQMVKNPETQEEYAIACDEFYALFRENYSQYIGIIDPAKCTPPYEKYVYCSPSSWIEAKKQQLRRRLDKVLYGHKPNFSGREFQFNLLSTINYYHTTDNYIKMIYPMKNARIK